LSLERKWQAENALAVLRAERKLQVLRANDVEDEVRRYRTRTCAATERAMVNIEKMHGQLRVSGNVVDGVGSAETILSEGGVPSLSSGTISPGSSASQAEFRAVQKEALDLSEKNGRYERAFSCMGLTLEEFELKDKSQWSYGTRNEEILDGMYPDGFAYETDCCDEGKFRPVAY